MAWMPYYDDDEYPPYWFEIDSNWYGEPVDDEPVEEEPDDE